MVISSSYCRPNLLPQLLSGELSIRQSNQLEEHLCSCDTCRSQLETLAGDDQWWRSTENALREVTLRTNDELIDSVDANRVSNVQRTRPDVDSEWYSKIAPDGRLGIYQLEQAIGHGGTGIVALAQDTQLGRRVAIKILYPHLAANGSARQRFAREAQAAATVVHPAVVPIHAVDASHDPPYLVMAYVPGGSLQQRLDRQGPFTLLEILRIGHQIAEGLSAAHRQGLVHRDVKPANILLHAGTDRVLLSDFGLARALDDASLTASGYIAGTPPYMSPEQARGDAVDARSDIFSVGSLLFAMAAGRPPFAGPSALNILRDVSESPTPHVRSINESMPIWLDRLIGLCHSKQPRDRISTAEQLADLIVQCLAHVQRPDAFKLPEVLRTKRVKPLTWIGLGLLVGSATAATALAPWISGDTPLESQKSFLSPVPSSSTQQIDNRLSAAQSAVPERQHASTSHDPEQIDQQLNSARTILQSLQFDIQGDWQ